MDNPLVVSNEEFGIDIEWKPRIGIEFSSENDAFDFYNAYGGKIGFSVRREYSNKSKKDKSIITSARFICNKKGCGKKDKRDVNIKFRRAETRTSCLARMGIMLSESGKYVCKVFNEEHNHPLCPPAIARMVRSQRNLGDAQALEVDLVHDSGIMPKATFAYMSSQVGGRQNLGYTQQDHKNYLCSKRQRELLYGEAGSLLLYFERQIRENHAFTYSIQLDIDEQITNIFWADSRMIIDYAQFGDVVTFETTYSTNKDCRPLGVFVGFNHHREVVIFGAALLYDGMTESFKWLFETFKSTWAKAPYNNFYRSSYCNGKSYIRSTSSNKAWVVYLAYYAKWHKTSWKFNEEWVTFFERL